MNLYELVREDDGRVNLRVSKVINPDVSDVPDISMSEYILTCFPLDKYDVEHAIIVGTDYYDKPLGAMHLSIGDYSSVWMYKRSAAIFLLLSGSRKFYIVHNHPDDDLSVSKDDMDANEQFDLLGQLLEIELAGSYIYGRRGWISCDEPKVIKEYRIDVDRG